MSTVRVEIHGLRDGGFCYGGRTDPTINRDYPSILPGTSVSQLAWFRFCDEIDTTLKSIGPIKKKVSRTMLVALALIVALVIIIPILITQNPIDKYYVPEPYQYFFFIFAVTFVIFCALFFCRRGVRLSRKLRAVYNELQKICANARDQFSDVSFNFITHRLTNGTRSWYIRYIEVTVIGLANENDNRTLATTESSSVDEFIISPMTDTLTIDERLEEFRRINNT